MHDCPDCGQACYCDGEDHDTGDSESCLHTCEPDIDDWDDETEDEFDRDEGYIQTIAANPVRLPQES